MDKKDGWKRYSRLKFDTKHFSKRAKRAETLTTKHAHKFVIQKLNRIRDVRQQITTWLVVIAGLITVVALQMVWYQSGYKTEAAVAGGTYAEAVLGPINTLNPLYATTSAELASSKLLFSSLFDYDSTGHLRDDVATSMSVDKTKKIYTVGLRDDVAWQDGSLLTADDVVYTINAMKNPDVRSVMRGSWTGVDVAALDDHTVQFTLPAANSPFPHALTFSILPKHILGDIEPGAIRDSTFSVSPVGSGPFVLRLLRNASSKDAHKIVYLSSWDDYYRGKVKIDRFELHAYESQEGIVHALLAHDVNAASDIGGIGQTLPNGFEAKDYPVNSGVYAPINTTSGAMKETGVRQALQRATSTRKIRDTLSVKAPELNLPFFTSQVKGSDALQKPAYDLKVANQLLDKAGWKLTKGSNIRMKKKQPLTLRLVAIKDQQYEKVAKALASQWSTLGIDVKVTMFDPNETSQNFTQSVLQPRDYDVLVNELSIGADPDVFVYWHSSQANPAGLNFSNYENGVADDALLSARVRSEPELRDAKYNTFAREWLKDVPAIGLYQSVMEYAHTPGVYSVEDSIVLPTANNRYASLQYWTAERGDVYKTP